MRARSDKESGFTLVELIVVVAIMAIVAGMAAPSFSNLIQGSAISVGANDLSSSFRLARSEAVKRGSRTSVCVSSSSLSPNPGCTAGAWDEGWIVYNDDNDNGSRDPLEDVLKVHEPLKFGFAAVSDAVFSNYVSFNAMGSATTNANGFASGVITLSYGTENRVISIMSNGRTKVQH